MRQALTTTAQQCSSAAEQTNAAIGAALRGNLAPVPLDPEDAADVLASLQATTRAIAVKPAPAFLGAPGTRSTGALAFGLPGQRTVALNNGPRLLVNPMMRSCNCC
jgi:hypothetical protein